MSPVATAPSRKTILFSYKKEISAGEISKIIKELFFWTVRALCFSALICKIGSGLFFGISGGNRVKSKMKSKLLLRSINIISRFLLKYRAQSVKIN